LGVRGLAHARRSTSNSLLALLAAALLAAALLAAALLAAALLALAAES
jgi:hypothetical protein